MNKKPRPTAQSQEKLKIPLHDRTCATEDVNLVKIEEKYSDYENCQATADLLSQILDKTPGSAQSYYTMGTILQLLKRYDEALENYDTALNLKPDYAEAHNKRGIILQLLKQHDEALASYEKAIMLKPDYAEAYNNMGVTLKVLKHYDESLASYNKAISFKSDYAEAYNNMGVTLKVLQHYDEALASYNKAITFKPDYADAHNNRGMILHELKRYDEALTSYNKALTFIPSCAEVHNNLGVTFEELKRYDEALASYDKAIALKPEYEEAYNNRGRVMVNKGDMQEAEKMFLKALAIKSDFPNPLYNITRIRKYQDGGHEDIKTIQVLLEKPGISLSDKEYYYYSLGKIYDDCGLYDDAFQYYLHANQIRNDTLPYNAPEVTNMTDMIIDVFSKEFLAKPVVSYIKSPVFIVGMPRSGTTLMANILSNHPSIGTAGELPTITEFSLRLPELIGNSIPYPQAAKYITPDISSRLAHNYEERLRRDIGFDVPYVIDKNPLNFIHLGFISMLFPQSRIIHCIRNPLDTALSNYFQFVSNTYSYSFDLLNIGHYYTEYARLMKHWRKVLPNKMIEICYEDMILNTQQVVRETLNSLGLEWHERCLSPHTNTCEVETSSNWQVRQPIYQHSVERWRNYEKHLGPLKEMLQII